MTDAVKTVGQLNAAWLPYEQPLNETPTVLELAHLLDLAEL